MTLRELRIGNFIYNRHADVVKVTEITEEQITYATGGWKSASISPIPLTEEWLKKFGFENNTNESDLNTHYIKQYGDFTFHFEVAKSLCYGHVNATYVDHINYVHQLQNLYFALTGEELSMKID